MKGTCKLCGTTETFLRKSHIIPRALYGDLSDEDPRGPLKLVPFDPKERAVTSRIGVYDRILCEACEKIMSDFDDYAIRVLRDMEPSETLHHKDGTIEGYLFAGVNLELLLLYSISLVWRAHTSEHNFFKSVQLGPHEANCRKAILERNIDRASGVDAIFGRFDDPRANGFINPYQEHQYGVRLYRFSAAQLTHGIKVDNRPFGNPLRHCSIRNTNNLIVLARVFKDSPEFRFMQKTLKGRPPIF